MNKIESSIEAKRQEASRSERCAAALAAFVGIETALSSVSAYTWRADGAVEISLTPERQDEAGALLHEVLRAVGQRKAEKRFDEYSGKVAYLIKAPGVEVTIKAVPPRCEVEPYTVNDYIPARYDTVTKFRLKNPAECLGASAPEKG